VRGRVRAGDGHASGTASPAGPQAAALSDPQAPSIAEVRTASMAHAVSDAATAARSGVDRARFGSRSTARSAHAGG
jgi:hypothetical protein